MFTWDWEDAAKSVDETLVTIEFKEAGEDRTEVIVTHERSADAARVGRHAQGWTELLRLPEGFIARRTMAYDDVLASGVRAALEAADDGIRNERLRTVDGRNQSAGVTAGARSRAASI